MTFESTDWEFSDMPTETEFVQPEAGDQYLYIKNAMYNPDAYQMDIEFKSLTNGAEFRVRYFMLTKEGKKNGFTGKVLRTLGVAVNNEDKVLAPNDIVGAVVRANVQFTMPKADNGKSYPKIEEFLPVSESLIEYSDKKDQYFLTDDA